MVYSLLFINMLDGMENDVMSKLEDIPKDILIGEKSILIGIAISLKRIADALEKLAKPVIMPELTPEQQEELMKANEDLGAGYVMFNKS